MKKNKRWMLCLVMLLVLAVALPGASADNELVIVMQEESSPPVHTDPAPPARDQEVIISNDAPNTQIVQEPSSPAGEESPAISTDGTRPVYRVTFYDMYGNVCGWADVPEGDYLIEPEFPDIAGFVFHHWYDESDLYGLPYAFGSPVHKHIHLWPSVTRVNDLAKDIVNAVPAPQQVVQDASQGRVQDILDTAAQHAANPPVPQQAPADNVIQNIIEHTPQEIAPQQIVPQQPPPAVDMDSEGIIATILDEATILPDASQSIPFDDRVIISDILDTMDAPAEAQRPVETVPDGSALLDEMLAEMPAATVMPAQDGTVDLIGTEPIDIVANEQETTIPVDTVPVQASESLLNEMLGEMTEEMPAQEPQKPPEVPAPPEALPDAPETVVLPGDDSQQLIQEIIGSQAETPEPDGSPETVQPDAHVVVDTRIPETGLMDEMLAEMEGSEGQPQPVEEEAVIETQDETVEEVEMPEAAEDELTVVPETQDGEMETVVAPEEAVMIETPEDETLEVVDGEPDPILPVDNAPTEDMQAPITNLEQEEAWQNPEEVLPQDHQEEMEDMPSAACVNIQYITEDQNIGPGSFITLVSEVEGVPEGAVIEYQWQNDAAGDYANVPGATGSIHTYVVQEENLDIHWRVLVNIQTA